MGPEDELADEAPELADEAAPTPDSGSDSGVEFASEGAVEMAGEAPDDDPYAPDDSAPKADLSAELADDAGDRASYGFEAARETARFEGAEPDPELAEASGVADDSDKFKIHGDEVPPPSFAEEAVATADPDAAYDPEPGGAEAEDAAYSSHFDADDSDDTTGVDAVEAPAVAEVSPVAEPEPEPEPPPRPAPVRPAPAPAKPAAPARPAAPPAAAGGDDKPGQIRRSALDEMFARAAELNKKKKK